MDKAQIELAKTLWEQSRAAALQSHEAWSLAMKSHKTLIDSMIGSGMPFSLAADQFEKLMQFHAEQYNAAREYMDKMSAEYRILLAQHKK